MNNIIFSSHRKFHGVTSNLVSILMDSCGVTRGSKNGLEVQIREKKASHLLDIDGDSCHHVHNSAKKFCDLFNRYLESPFTQLYNDHKWSPDLREALSEIFTLLSDGSPALMLVLALYISLMPM